MRASGSRWIRLGVLLSLVLAVLGGAIALGEVIHFPDDKLEAAVREALDKPTGDITVADMETLTELDGADRGISSLVGLEYAVNLELLELWENEIGDLSPLSGLIKLEMLWLYRNEISDLMPLSGLTQLRKLSLWQNEISDLTPLSGLTQLETLRLQYNEIIDITALSGLARLWRLELEHNEIRDIAPLAGLSRLERLDLAFNELTDILPLVLNSDAGGLGAGDRVLLRNNYLDLTPGSDAMEDIETLLARGVEVDYQPQREPPPQYQLDVSSTEGGLVTEPGEGSFVYEAGEVVELRAEAQEGYGFVGWVGDIETVADPGRADTTVEMLDDYAVVAEFERLSYTIAASAGQGGSIAPDGEVMVLHGDDQAFTIAPGPGYETADVLVDGVSAYEDLAFENHVSTYTFETVADDHTIHATFYSEVVQFPDANLAEMLAEALGLPAGEITVADLLTLTSLDLSGRGISSLAGLEHAVNLRELDLSGNEISELSPLAALVELEWLDLSFNQISDLAPLAGLTYLQVLLLSNNAISDISPLVESSDAGGLGPGDKVDLTWNFLDLTPGSDAMDDIDELLGRGVDVDYEPQRVLVCVDIAPGWALLGIAMDLEDRNPGSLEITPEAAFSYLYRWDPGTRRYLAAHRDEITELEKLHGYWLYLSRERAAYEVCVEGTALTGEQEVELGPAGWQMIGVPYPVAWGDAAGGSMRFRRNADEKTLAESITAGWVLNTIYAWDSTEGVWIRYRAVDGETLEPWTGYFLYTLQDDLELIFSEEQAAWPAGFAWSVAARAYDPGEPPLPVLPVELPVQGLDAVAYPNPVADGVGVTFTVRGPEARWVEAISVRVHDLSGRLVYQGDGGSLLWDTMGVTGAPVASGVYLYTVQAKLDGEWVSAAVEKLLILR